MKKLESQVCTIEQARRLEQLLGEDLESALYWVNDGGTLHIAIPCAKGFVTVDETGEAYTESGLNAYNAWTVAELGIMLPPGTGWTTRMLQGPDGLYCRVESGRGIYSSQPTEAMGRADALIHLLENNIITADEVNARLTAKPNT